MTAEDAGEGDKLPAGYRLRALKPEDHNRLHAAERASTSLFADHGFAETAVAPYPFEDFLKLFDGAETIVAADRDGRAVGVVAARDIAGACYIVELFVDPAHGRQGLGHALLAAAVDRARQAGYGNVALSTFRAVPFNQPFYQRRGFVAVDLAEAPPAMREQFAREIPHSASAADRVLMIRRI